MARLKVGDVFEIPLSEDRVAYGQYVYFDKKMGPLIRVFDLITSNKVDVNFLKQRNPLFPPVITGLMAAIRTGLWKVIGHFPVNQFTYPNFVTTFHDQKTGKAGIWSIWNGEKFITIGPNLPMEYKKLEFLIVWDPHDVVHRIETGEYLFPYADLIQKNEYTPREILPKDKSNVS